VNEILTRSIIKQLPFIEFYNTNNVTVDISSWIISNETTAITLQSTTKELIPPGSIIRPNGYLVLYTSVFKTLSFRPTGGAVAIYDISFKLQDVFVFGVSPAGKSFGRYQTPDGRIVDTLMNNVTNGTVNGPPLFWPLIILEMLYDINSYVVLFNTQTINVNLTTIYLNPWAIQVSNNKYLLPKMSLAPGYRLVITGLDVQTFNSIYTPLSRTLIYTIPGFSVTKNDNISVIQPDELVSNYITNPSYISMETVSYSSWLPNKPFPNPFLTRRGIMLFADDTYSWASLESPIAISCCYVDSNSPIYKYPNIVYPLDPIFVPELLNVTFRAIFYSLFVIVVSVLTSILFMFSINWILINGISVEEQQ